MKRPGIIEFRRSDSGSWQGILPLSSELCWKKLSVDTMVGTVQTGPFVSSWYRMSHTVELLYRLRFVRERLTFSVGL